MAGRNLPEPGERTALFSSPLPNDYLHWLRWLFRLSFTLAAANGSAHIVMSQGENSPGSIDPGTLRFAAFVGACSEAPLAFQTADWLFDNVLRHANPIALYYKFFQFACACQCLSKLYRQHQGFEPVGEVNPSNLRRRWILLLSSLWSLALNGTLSILSALHLYSVINSAAFSDKVRELSIISFLICNALSIFYLIQTGLIDEFHKFLLRKKALTLLKGWNLGQLSEDQINTRVLCQQLEEMILARYAGLNAREIMTACIDPRAGKRFALNTMQEALLRQKDTIERAYALYHKGLYYSTSDDDNLGLRKNQQWWLRATRWIKWAVGLSVGILLWFPIFYTRLIGAGDSFGILVPLSFCKHSAEAQFIEKLGSAIPSSLLIPLAAYHFIGGGLGMSMTLLLKPVGDLLVPSFMRWLYEKFGASYQPFFTYQENARRKNFFNGMGFLSVTLVLWFLTVVVGFATFIQQDIFLSAKNGAPPTNGTLPAHEYFCNGADVEFFLNEGNIWLYGNRKNVAAWANPGVCMLSLGIWLFFYKYLLHFYSFFHDAAPEALHNNDNDLRENFVKVLQGCSHLIGRCLNANVPMQLLDQDHQFLDGAMPDGRVSPHEFLGSLQLLKQLAQAYYFVQDALKHTPPEGNAGHSPAGGSNSFVLATSAGRAAAGAERARDLDNSNV